jgi:MOSC domain-containing protein YiiM
VTGRLEAIFVAPSRGAAMTAVASVVAVAGRGLEGDRYFATRRRLPGAAADEREVTLIEAEVLEALAAGGLPLTPGASRRNLVTRGVALNDLVGTTWSIGEVVLRGQLLCEPCTRLARTTSREVMRALVHRGGLRAQIVTGGTLRVGDPIGVP